MAGRLARSFRTKQFKEQFERLPASVQKSAINSYKNYFCVNPFHPLLKRHDLHDVRDAPASSFAVTIAYGYRAVGFYDEKAESYIWYWCGPHAKYDQQTRPGR